MSQKEAHEALVQKVAMLIPEMDRIGPCPKSEIQARAILALISARLADVTPEMDDGARDWSGLGKDQSSGCFRAMLSASALVPGEEK